MSSFFFSCLPSEIWATRIDDENDKETTQAEQPSCSRASLRCADKEWLPARLLASFLEILVRADGEGGRSL
jgi:hypothetical protein